MGASYGATVYVDVFIPCWLESMTQKSEEEEVFFGAALHAVCIGAEATSGIITDIGALLKIMVVWVSNVVVYK